jgi:hypothetical protein
VERTLISWNLPNFVSVVLMAFGAFLFFALALQLTKKWRRKDAA